MRIYEYDRFLISSNILFSTDLSLIFMQYKKEVLDSGLFGSLVQYPRG